jgi:hypothetical protein
MTGREKKVYIIHTILSIIILAISAYLIIFIVKVTSTMKDPRDVVILLGLIFLAYVTYLISSTIRISIVCKRPPIINTIVIIIILAYIAYYHMREFCPGNYKLLTVEHVETALQDIMEQNCADYKNAAKSETCLTTFDIVKQENPHCFEQNSTTKLKCNGNATITDMRFKTYTGYREIYYITREKNDVLKVILGYIFSKVYYKMSSEVGSYRYNYYRMEIPCKID